MRLAKRSQFILVVLVLAATLVAGSACGTSNHPPVITSLTANPAAVSPGGNSSITCVATDADSDPLTYTWTGTGGAITGNGSSVILTAPTTPGSYNINVVVSDGRGGTDTRGVAVTVATTVSTGSIDIASTPVGAAIYIDGVDSGSVTPLTISNVAEGNHSIMLTYYHYIDKIGVVTVNAGVTTAINWPLTLAPDQTLTIQPNVNASKDTFVSQENPDTNYEGNNLLIDEHALGTQGRSYLQFNLSSLPSGAIITNASLGLYYTYSDVLSTPASIGAYEVTGDWNVSAITWNNQPAHAAAAESTTIVPIAPTDDFIYWDILNLAKGWFTGAIPNNGVVLAAINESTTEGARIFLASIAAVAATQHPKLEITYFNPLPLVLQLNVSIP